MSSIEEYKKTLENCNKAVALLQARDLTNKEVAKYNNNLSEAHRVATETWKNTVQENGRIRAEINNCIINESNRLRGEERIWNNCVSWGNANDWKHDDWCHKDTQMDVHDHGTGGCTPGFGKGVCKWSENQVYIMSRQNCNDRQIADPVQPQLTGLKQMDTTTLNINCCNNIMDITGSDISSSIIEQSNSCIANTERSLTKANEQEQLKKQADAKRLEDEKRQAILDKQQAELDKQQAEEEKQAQQEQQAEKQKQVQKKSSMYTTRNAMIVSFVIISSCTSLAIIIMLLLVSF